MADERRAQEDRETSYLRNEFAEAKKSWVNREASGEDRTDVNVDDAWGRARAEVLSRSPKTK
ncbi:MAG: hypothetical protein ABSH35_33100 [Isosphaeraceae bacterium]|jgi:hypothetical protein